MDQAYWLRRERDSIAHARAATLGDVRLIHYDLATAYSLKAAEAGRAHRELRSELVWFEADGQPHPLELQVLAKGPAKGTEAKPQ